MSTTVRLTLDQEMLNKLAEVQYAYPGLKPSQIIRFGFFRFAETDPNVQNTSKISNESFVNLINDFKQNSPLENTSDNGIQGWWAKAKKKLRK